MPREYRHEVDAKGKVKVTDETPTRGARNSEKGWHGDMQKDGIGSRLIDGVLKRLGK
jgi:hypothetical protein